MVDMRFLLFIVLLSSLLSCSNSEIQIEEQPLNTLYTLNMDLIDGQHPYFVMLSDQDGENLYDTFSRILNDEIVIELEEETKINVTYGVETNVSFGINTLVDVPSGSTIKTRQRGFVDDECFLYDLPSLISPVKLTITDIGEIDDYHVPFFSYRPLAHEDSTLLILGGVNDDMDMQLTLKEKNTSKYKSYIFKPEDWSAGAADTLVRTISYKEFCQPSIYEIDLGHDLSWALQVSACTEDERLVMVHNWTSWEQYQEAPSVKFFLIDEIPQEQIRIEVFNSRINEGFAHVDLYQETPSSISLLDAEVNFSVVEADRFVLSTPADYTINRCVYEYWAGQASASWDVINLKTADFAFTFPSLPQDYLDRTQFIKNSLNRLQKVFNHKLKFEQNLSNLTEYPYDLRFYGGTASRFDLHMELIKEF